MPETPLLQAIAFIDRAGDPTVSGITDPVPWWSFSKTVLAIAALRLVDSASLTLDATRPGERYSLRQLLRHEAGLPDYGQLDAYHADVAAGAPPWTLPRLLAATQADRLRYDPGTGWAYSNIGYLKVAQLIAQTSDQPLAAALAELVFAPAGITTARLALTPADLETVRMGGAHAYHPGWVYHGLIVGTAEDAARLLWLLVHGHLLQPSTYMEMTGPRALRNHRTPTNPDPAYGLGLMLQSEQPQASPIGHNGEGPGSRIAVWAKGGKTAAVWMTSPSAIDPEIQALQLIARMSDSQPG